ncbi:Fe-S cluster assembly sulfur transfer protein SufU [Enterococcus timonensis]|uniref:Fe-S cluster assembly sulfur transfer protein SufU n=1 Tax=Enterococcus timonensis TaxID=1852364 RepID=UPI0008D94D91|nr:SUF system NifU family Fe-S cluster assembly protein [Enterococcus timonensis]
MGLSKLDTLYRQVILEHSAQPHHHGKLSGDATNEIELNNPTCGDVISLQVKIDDGKISEIAFDGSGCSISTASASMMTDAVLGKTVEEAQQLVLDFSKMVQGEIEAPDELGDAGLLSGVAKFPARIKCATLAWKALYQAVDKEEQDD